MCVSFWRVGNRGGVLRLRCNEPTFNHCEFCFSPGLDGHLLYILCFVSIVYSLGHSAWPFFSVCPLELNAYEAVYTTMLVRKAERSFILGGTLLPESLKLPAANSDCTVCGTHAVIILLLLFSPLPGVLLTKLFL